MAETYTREALYKLLDRAEHEKKNGNGSSNNTYAKANAGKKFRFYSYLLRRMGTNDTVTFPQSVIDDANKNAGNPSR